MNGAFGHASSHNLRQIYSLSTLRIYRARPIPKPTILLTLEDSIGVTGALPQPIPFNMERQRARKAAYF